ncbi:uncharacterized protein PV07_10180 [Cladophialophora immunda]|uniref:CID domain-containing protein n=1 Tax=Cladophialophora immunda TaxID=569365 RepID=A0A0D2CLQ5_9EURO|nr:uncharacterized protein PV07_10180 [Cladophialophora immunda]KIW24469.1 hypothetical protein PV07_10180 [Cladophialophora immunda]OQV02667.1 RNA polymerase II-binding domain-containing protein [Cladophialophora immunda]
MSYSDEALKAKLSTLNETQDSIVSVSQWIMFHKRHADRIANYWLTRLRDSPPAKRLNFIYLVNDIVQNARARKRSEFPDAFSPLMAEAIQTAYRSSPPEIQSKIRRVVEVWRTRNVFEVPILDAIDARVDEIDKSKGSGGKKTLMGNSLFGSTSSSGAMPKELESLAPLQITVTKETISARPAIDNAQNEYAKLNDPEAVLPSPPVHAARLSSLIKSLAAAESSVSASIKARKALIADLERILEINKAALAKDEETYLTLESRKASTEAKKREVEDAIIRGLSSAEAASSSEHFGGTHTGVASSGIDAAVNEIGGNNVSGEHSASHFLSERPEIEELTDDEGDFASGGMFDQPPPSNAQWDQPAPAPAAPASPGLGSFRPNNPAVAAALADFSAIGSTPTPDYTAFLPSSAGGHANAPAMPRVRSASGGQGVNGLGAKRRKISHGGEEQVPDLGEMGMEGFGQVQSQDQGAGTFGGAGPGVGGQQTETRGDDLLKNLDEDVDELLRQEAARGSNGVPGI